MALPGIDANEHTKGRCQFGNLPADIAVSQDSQLLPFKLCGREILQVAPSVEIPGDGPFMQLADG